MKCVLASIIRSSEFMPPRYCNKRSDTAPPGDKVIYLIYIFRQLFFNIFMFQTN